MGKMSWLWWMIFLLTCAAQINTDTNGASLGGRLASSGEFSYVVFIAVPPFLLQDNLCAGTLATLSHVISYASCFDHLGELSEYKVIGGTVDAMVKDKRRQERKIVNVVVHKGFKNIESSTKNIALAVLNKPFKITSTLSAIKMESINEQYNNKTWYKFLKAGKNCSALSWTATDVNNPTIGPQYFYDYSLKVVDLIPWTEEQCAQARWVHKDDVVISEGTVCLGYARSEDDVCPSDIGSILACDNLFFGVGDFAMECGNHLYKNFFLFWPHVKYFDLTNLIANKHRPPPVKNIPGEDKKLGGRFAENGEYPFTVQIGFLLKDSTPFRCVGTLATLSRIITCAHCFNPNYVGPLSTYKVSGGTVELKKPDEERQERDIVNVTVHEGYNEALDFSPHDIAVAELDKPFTKTCNLFVMNIASEDEHKNKKAWDLFVETGKLCTAVGWGAVMIKCLKTKVYTDTLKVVELNPWTDDKCNEARINEEVNMTSQGDVCLTQARAKEGMCQGDSGSTLVCDGYVFGMKTSVGECGINDYQSFLLFWPYINYFGLKKCSPCSSPNQRGSSLVILLATALLLIPE